MVKQLSTPSKLGLGVMAVVIGGLFTAFVSILTPVGKSKGISWVVFTTPDGMCRGVLPENFEYNADELEIDGQVSEWGQWIGDTRVAIATLPANLGSNESAEDRYESSAVGLAEAWDGFVVLSESIESAGVEGRHQIINTGPVVFRRHFYIVNEVALIAVATYPEHDHDESVVEHFLSRFELLRDGAPVAPLDPIGTLNSRELE